MSVVEESAVAVDLRIGSLVENVRDLARVEGTGKLRAVRFLDTMHRPKNLLDPVEHDAVARCFARVIRGEAAVVWRMPVLRRDDEIETSLQFIGQRKDLVAARDCQRAS